VERPLYLAEESESEESVVEEEEEVDEFPGLTLQYITLHDEFLTWHK